MPVHKEENAIAIKVRSKDDESEDTKTKPPTSKAEEAAAAEEDEDMSEEDKQLKEDLELSVTRVTDAEPGVQKLAVESLRSKIKSATSSMTSVPKPLKFLGPHYETLKAAYKGLASDSGIRTELADVLSVLAMTMATEDSRESLHFKLSGCTDDVAAWGHEYVRNLAGEISQEYRERTEKDEPEAIDDLVDLSKKIVKFDMSHNAEAEAVDLLMEVQQLPLLLPLEFDERNIERVCAYLIRSALYESDPEERTAVFQVAYELYMKQGRHCDALRVALRMKSTEKLEALFEAVDDSGVRQQMAFILGRHRAFGFQLDEDEVDDADVINGHIGNSYVLSTNYRRLAQALDVMEAKTPNQVYKSHLGDTASTARSGEAVNATESAAQNAASTFVNGFVNIGFGVDKLITVVDEKGRTHWLYKNKERGMHSAAASLGMVHQWDIDDGFGALDKFLYVDDVNIKAGGVLGIGICNAGVYNTEVDAAIGILPEYLEEDKAFNKDGNVLLQCSAILGLGLAYAGTAREDVVESLADFVSGEDGDDDEASKGSAMDNRATVAALSIGMICAGTADGEVAQSLIERMLLSTEAERESPEMKLFCLGLGLIFLGCEEEADVSADILKTITDEKFRKFAEMTLKTCAYAGTGNVLKVQEMLHACAEHIDSADDAAHQMVAVLGIALVTMGEEVGKSMAMRTMEHLLQYGETPIRRAIPLAMALLFVSNPDYSVTDLMSKLSHDSDEGVAMSAILALGLIGAGTNNSRIAGLLRHLSDFYKSKKDPLYVVRIAQGLLHMGKGLVSLNPFHSEGLLLSTVQLSSLLVFLHSALNVKKTMLGSLHYLLYCLAPAVTPRMLVTLDEEGEMVPVTVRVGQTVDTVGQAGQPRRITGFQTHTTPVLLAANERAELVDTDKYEALTTVLEGFVILREKKKKGDADGSTKESKG